MNTTARVVMRLILIAFGAAIVLLSPVNSGAQQTAGSPGADSATTTIGDTASAVPETSSGSGRTTKDYVDEVRGNFTPENRAYWMTNLTLTLIGTVYGVVVALFFLFSGLSARIRDFAHAKSKGRYGRMLIYFTIYSLLGFVIAFPLSWYQGFLVEHQYGLSNQTFVKWFVDELKGLGIGILISAVIPLVMLAYLAIEKIRNWWIVLAVGSVPVIVIFTLLTPLVFDPMFNKFTPLKDKQLEQQILALAGKAGIPSRNVYQVDKSEQTKKFNAYVSGFGTSQRIVLWDTTLEGMQADEILFVMGHEMGHYRLGHIWKGIAYFSLLSVFIFLATGWMMTWAVRRFGSRWGFHQLHDIASIPLFGLALSVAGFVTQPIQLYYTRSVEHEADTFALEVTHSNDAGARAFIKLGSQNKSNPEPPTILKVMMYSHPPLVERVRYAMEYRPWEEGKPNAKYHPKE